MSVDVQRAGVARAVDVEDHFDLLVLVGLRPVVRAEQPDLFGAEHDEPDRGFEVVFDLREQSRDLAHEDGPDAVVVRALRDVVAVDVGRQQHLFVRLRAEYALDVDRRCGSLRQSTARCASTVSSSQ